MGTFTRLLFLLATPVLAAQQTWNVPSGANVDTYIAQANPGDVLVLNGGYYYVNVTKGVTILGNGCAIAGVSFQVPPGQRASLSDANLTGIGFPLSGGGLSVASGTVALSNLSFQGRGLMTITTGEVVMQRISGSCSLLVGGGTCSIADSTISGSSATYDYSFGTGAAQPGILQTGGYLVVSHSTISGGNGGTGGWPWTFYIPAAIGFRQSSGVAWMTDCTITGGAGLGAFDPGGEAVQALGSTELARTTITDGAFAAATSSGWQSTPVMVGMTSSAPPLLGTSFTVTAKAGSSPEPMGIIAGFTRYSNTVSPVLEPLFVDPTQFVGLAITVPAIGGTLSSTVAVPNLPALRGAEVWLQAVQVDGTTLRASSAVGGSMR